jgi:Tetratricopeptide repeat
MASPICPTHALALDPRSGEAQGLLASTLTRRVLAGMTNSHAADIGRAEALVEQALAASPRNTIAHYTKGQLLRAEGRCEEAIPEFEAVVASNRNSAGALFHLGMCKIRGGRPTGGAGNPPEPPRSRDIQPVYCDWGGAFAAIAYQRGDRLVRKSAERQSEITIPAHLARLRLCPQRLFGSRPRRTCRGSQAGRRQRWLFKHRAHEGHRVLGGAESPRLSPVCTSPGCQKSEHSLSHRARGSGIGSSGQTGRRTLVKSSGV